MAPDAAQTDALPSGAPASIWSRPYRFLTLGLLLVISGAAFEALAVATVMPATVRDLGSTSLYGWVFSAFMLADLVGIVVAGTESDRQGPARPFAAGVVCFAGGLVLAGLAPSMLVVIIGRTVQGGGAGILTSVAYVIIGRGYPATLKPRMLAALSSAWVIPGLVGPGLAGLVADHFGWRWVFLGLALLPPFAAIMAWPALRLLPRTEAIPRDWHRIRAALSLALGAGLLIVSLSLQPLALVLLLLAAGGVLLSAALRQVLPPGTLYAAPGLPAAIASMGLLNLAFFGVDSFVPLALTATRGQSVTIAGLVLTAGTLCWTSGAWLAEHEAARRSRRQVALVGLALIALGISGVAAVLAPMVWVLLALVAWGVAGLGIGMAYTTISLVVLEKAPAGHEGAASASMSLAGALGVALGTGLGGVLIGAAGPGAEAVRVNLAIQDALMIVAAGLAALAASRLGGNLRGRGGLSPALPGKEGKKVGLHN